MGRKRARKCLEASLTNPSRLKRLWTRQLLQSRCLKIVQPRELSQNHALLARRSWMHKKRSKRRLRPPQIRRRNGAIRRRSSCSMCHRPDTMWCAMSLGLYSKCACLEPLTCQTILIQMTNGIYFGQIAVCKLTSFTEWSRISALTISPACTHLLARITWLVTCSACKSYSPRTTNSSLRHGSCQQSSANSRGSSATS